MAKKKKKKKVNCSLLNEVDNALDSTYENIINEIQEFQLQLNLADQQARKKVRKQIRKDPSYFQNSRERVEARREVVNQIEGNNLLERVQKLFQDLCPIIVVISRLIASLILGILSLEPVKMYIKPKTLETMNSIYNLAIAIK